MYPAQVSDTPRILMSGCSVWDSDTVRNDDDASGWYDRANLICPDNGPSTPKPRCAHVRFFKQPTCNFFFALRSRKNVRLDHPVRMTNDRSPCFPGGASHGP